MKRPLILFAPGAGAPSSSGWMRGWTKRLSAVGDVVRFDYAYLKEKRGAPDRLPILIEDHRVALARARRNRRGPVVLAGKSMGSRIGCHLSLEERVDALICFGYPLVGQSGAVRDEVLYALRTPVLFIQGTRDRLCPLDHLERVRQRMRAPSTLHVVEEGDHSLVVTRRWLEANGQTQDDVDVAVLDVIRRHLRAHLP